MEPENRRARMLRIFRELKEVLPIDFLLIRMSIRGSQITLKHRIQIRGDIFEKTSRVDANLKDWTSLTTPAIRSLLIRWVHYCEE